MREKLRKNGRSLLMMLLLLVFVVSVGGLLYDQAEYRLGEQAYDEAMELAGLDVTKLSDGFFLGEAELPSEAKSPEEPGQQEPAPPKTPTAPVIPWQTVLEQLDLDALRAVNSDVLGWIVIPGTVVSYPYVQGGDNDYYLRRTWKGNRNRAGCIMMECTNSPDLSDFHTILYGHNLRNGAMFSCLPSFRNASYWRNHPTIYLADDSGIHRYDIFSVRKVDLQDVAYRLDLNRTEVREELIQTAVEQSVVQTGIVPTVQDHILTLSTCTNTEVDLRWIVQAVLRVESKAETPPEEQTSSEGQTPAENQESPEDPALPEDQTVPENQTPEDQTSPEDPLSTENQSPAENSTSPGELTPPEGQAVPESQSSPENQLSPENQGPPENGATPTD